MKIRGRSLTLSLSMSSIVSSTTMSRMLPFSSGCRNAENSVRFKASFWSWSEIVMLEILMSHVRVPDKSDYMFHHQRELRQCVWGVHERKLPVTSATRVSCKYGAP